MKGIKNIVVSENIQLAFPDKQHGEDLNTIIINERERLLRWLPWVENYLGIEDSKIFQGISVKNFEARKSFGFTILFDGKPVGVMGTHNVDYLNQRTTVGYWISQDYERKGIISACVKSLLRFCFEDLNLNKVEIWSAVNNERSNSVPKRLGFKHEGVLRQVEKNIDGFVDVNVWGLIKNEWK